jgi:AcrR family transcriptional regulator
MANEKLKEQNIQKVLEASMQCFLRYGIENTQMKDIASAAGVSIRSISRYFANKDELVVQVTQFHIALQKEREEELLAELQASEQPAIEKVRQYLLLIKQAFWNNYEFCIFLANSELYLGQTDTNQQTSLVFFDHFCYLTHILRDFLNAGIEQGSITKITDVEMEAKMLCQSYFGFLIQLALTRVNKRYSDREYDAIINYYIKRVCDNLN